MNTGALAGVRVLDLSRVLAGPYCTMLLGDYGADVIKVEEPSHGDGTRSWGPPWVGDQSAYYLAANRNKRSLTVNLKAAEGVAIVQRLAAISDVVIENFKPGTASRMGIGYDTLAAENSGLIYCSLTGYGQNGPYCDRPGYDFVIQAQGGLMSITGPAEGEPYKVGVAIADITTGLFAATAILAALHERQQSGRGQAIDVALLDAQVAWLANVAQNYLATGTIPARYGNAHPSIVPYETFPTGNGAIAVAIGTDEQYRKFCLKIERSDLCEDDRFRTNSARVAESRALDPYVAGDLPDADRGSVDRSAAWHRGAGRADQRRRRRARRRTGARPWHGADCRSSNCGTHRPARSRRQVLAHARHRAPGAPSAWLRYRSHLA